jgi:hypothetical protein
MGVGIGEVDRIRGVVIRRSACNEFFFKLKFGLEWAFFYLERCGIGIIYNEARCRDSVLVKTQSGGAQDHVIWAHRSSWPLTTVRFRVI